jgi:hypothetical protein
MERYEFEMMQYVQFTDKIEHIANQDFRENPWISTTYKNMKYLQFSNCKFPKNFFSIYENENLEVLCFKFCEFSGDNDFKNLPNLTKLYFKNNCVFHSKTLELTGIPKLHTLIILDTNLKNFKLVSEEIKLLEILNVEYEKFDIDAPNLNQLGLEKMHIFDCRKFPKLEIFKALACSFDEILLPDSLKIFDLNYRSEYGKLENLKFLSNCKSLINLKIYRYEIQSFSGIENCPIYRLYLTNCLLKNIDDIEPLKNTLTELILTFNEISDINILNNLKKLQIVKLGCNSIRKINLNLPEVIELDLAINLINEIFLTAPNLRYLNISCNECQNLDFVSETEKLGFISLRNNQVTDLTPLIYLNYLQDIHCENNPILYENIPDEIIEITDVYENLNEELEEFEEGEINVYTNKQNVHSSNIVKSVRESILNLLKEKSSDIMII